MTALITADSAANFQTLMGTMKPARGYAFHAVIVAFDYDRDFHLIMCTAPAGTKLTDATYNPLDPLMKRYGVWLVTTDRLHLYAAELRIMPTQFADMAIMLQVLRQTDDVLIPNRAITVFTSCNTRFMDAINSIARCKSAVSATRTPYTTSSVISLEDPVVIHEGIISFPRGRAFSMCAYVSLPLGDDRETAFVLADGRAFISGPNLLSRKAIFVTVTNFGNNLLNVALTKYDFAAYYVRQGATRTVIDADGVTQQMCEVHGIRVPMPLNCPTPKQLISVGGGHLYRLTPELRRYVYSYVRM